MPMKDAETSTAEARLYSWCVVNYLHVATTLLSGSLTYKQCSQVAR